MQVITNNEQENTSYLTASIMFFKSWHIYLRENYFFFELHTRSYISISDFHLNTPINFNTATITTTA